MLLTLPGGAPRVLSSVTPPLNPAPVALILLPVLNKSIPFIDYDNLKGDVAKAFNQALQKGEKSPDLGIEEFVAINNS